MSKKILFVLLILVLLQPGTPVSAQAPSPVTGPIYIIQPGDTLSSIATGFRVSLNDLIAANNIVNANNISAGTQLIIPGLEDLTGFVTTNAMAYGDTLNSLSRRTQISLPMLRRLNHITNPEELYAGANIVSLQNEAAKPLTNRLALSNGETLLEASVRSDNDPWTLSRLNSLNGTWNAIPGEVLYAQGIGSENVRANGMPQAFVNVEVNPLPITQGGTVEIIVEAQPGVQLSGLLVDKPLLFFPLGNNKYAAIQGVYALLNPGPYPLEIAATLPDGTKQAFEQKVVIQDGHYPTDPVLVVGSETTDPVENEAEQKQLAGLIAPVTSTKYWQGGFQSPVLPEFTDCHPSYFGNRRNYIGSGTDTTYHSFHAGLDFCEQVGNPITAAAEGIVVFTGMLTVHGNTTIIDHGWGIYSMYSHQSQIDVQVGQQVKSGEQIGLAGRTGRVTGPHLHFEVWVNGIQVNPLDWLKKTYP